MNKSVNIAFVTLGVLFIVLLLMGIGYSLSVTQGSDSANYAVTPTADSSSDTANSSDSEADDTAFTLSTDQKQALSSFGIDPASAPSSISVEQEACLVAVLGLERVEEIKAGAAPSAADFFQANNCL